VFDLRVSGIIAGAAFFLSFLIGLVSRARMPSLILRPLIFAILFFAIPILVKFLVGRFLPELLEEYIPDDTDLLPGSRVNIMEADTFSGFPSPGSAPVVSSHDFMGARPDDSDDGVGDISGLAGIRTQAAEVNPQAGFSGAGMDQNTEDGYTERKDLGDFSGAGKNFDFEPLPPPFAVEEGAASEPVPAKPGSKVQAEPKRSGGGAAPFFDSGDLLPDLDSMAGAFSSNASFVEEPDTTEYSVSTPAKKSSSQSKGSEWAGDFNPKEIAMGLQTILKKDKEG
jgi:hypothetical protein